jgi:hypothetical protein
MIIFCLNTLGYFSNRDTLNTESPLGQRTACPILALKFTTGGKKPNGELLLNIKLVAKETRRSFGTT